MNELCEVCQEKEVAVKAVRTWHDGAVDVVLICADCFNQPSDGAWKMEKQP
jgi:hypothetical protein